MIIKTRTKITAKPAVVLPNVMPTAAPVVRGDESDTDIDPEGETGTVTVTVVVTGVLEDSEATTLEEVMLATSHTVKAVAPIFTDTVTRCCQ